jgi:tetratricopeptide (TPR) repeat protein
LIPCECLESGQIAKAIAMYRQLRQNDPAHPDVRERRINNLGYSLLNANKTREAVALLKLNAEWYPRSANAWDSLGEACLKAGDRDLAIRNYEKALQLDPGSVSAQDALKRLGEK